MSYQLLIVFIPFITIPYISRMLTTEQMGISNFLTSSIQFLNICILAGLGQYGVRVIRNNFDEETNNDNLGVVFFSLYFYQFVFGIICLCIYIFFILFLDFKHIYALLTLPLLLSGIFDISWFFQGIEHIQKVLLRNTIIKVSTLILILLFVKSSKDFYLYLIIVSIGNLLGNISLWIVLFKIIPFKKIFMVTKLSICSFKKTLYLLIPQLAIQIYITLDVVLLGFMSNDNQVAYYSQSQKLIRMISTIISSFSIVLLPRMVANIKNKSKFNFFFSKSLVYTTFISCLLFAVVYSNIPNFILWFFGSKYISMVNVMYIISPLIVFIPIGGVFSNQLAISLGKDKEYIIPVLVGAIVSLIFNLVLIPKYEAIGAAITALIVEFIVLILRIFIIKDFFKIEQLESSIYLISIAILLSLTFKYINLNIFNSLFLNILVTSLLIVILFFFISFLLVKDINEDIKFIRKNKKKPSH